MRIGQFSDTFIPVVDGVGRVATSYAAALAKRGEEVYAVAPMANTGYRGGYPFELIDFIAKPIPLSKQYNAGVAGLDTHYEKRMERVSFDLIHAHTPFFAGEEAYRRAAEQNCPLVGTYHANIYDDFVEATGGELWAQLTAKLAVDFYARCDEVWAFSQSAADTLHGYGYKGEIVLMPHGVALHAPDPKQAERAARRFHIPKDRPVLLFAGQLNWRKDLLTVLEAAALLKVRGQRFTLVMAGRGRDAEAIMRKAEWMGLYPELLYTGHIHDDALLDGLYQLADVFLFPSTHDCTPMSLREAAVMGTPSIVTKGGAATECIRDGENGFIAKPGAEALAQRLSQILAEPALIQRAGENAKASIPISWDVVMDQVTQRYTSLVERYKAQGRKKRRLATFAQRYPSLKLEKGDLPAPDAEAENEQQQQ